LEKIKIGNTRFDVTGGMGSIAVLAARLLTQSTKSSVTDKITKLNEVDKNGKPKFAGRTGLDLFEDFFENKLSPVAGEGLNWLKGSTRDGDPFTFTGAGMRLVTPLPAKNTMETFKDPNSAPLLAAVLADAFGIAASTYGGSKDIENQIKDAQKRGDSEEVEKLKKALKETQKIEAEKKKELKPKN
jgi:hypothetical protein